MDIDSGSESYSSTSYKCWIEEFLMKKGHDYFCEVDIEYILDKFNLTGLSHQISCFSAAINVITDKIDVNSYTSPQTRQTLAAAAHHVYGLIHARYIITARGLQKMADKLKLNHFGSCPRALCYRAPMVPIGLSDETGISTMRLYCYHCQDIYTPAKLSSRHIVLDGAFWGTTFPHLLLQVYPQLSSFHFSMSPSSSSPSPSPSSSSSSSSIPSSLNMYVPKIFGFRVHELSQLQRERLKLKHCIHSKDSKQRSHDHPVVAFPSYSHKLYKEKNLDGDPNSTLTPTTHSSPSSSCMHLTDNHNVLIEHHGTQHMDQDEQ